MTLISDILNDTSYISLNDIINDFIKKYNHNKYLLISIIIINFQLKIKNKILKILQVLLHKTYKLMW